MCVSSYSKVDAVEQRDMVNSGVRGTKDRNLRTEGDYRNIVPIIYPIIFKYLVPVIYSIGTPGGVVASGSSLVLPRAAADTRGQYSTLRYTGPSVVRYAMRGKQRGAQGAGEEERRRDEGTGDRAKEAARTAGGKAAGALVIGG
jgi:hypothetical protein